MSNTLSLIATGSAVGSGIPLLTAIVQDPRWPAGAKRVVAVLAALLGGVVTVISTGGIAQFEHPLPALGAIAAVLAASQTTYNLIWKPSKLAPAVENATSRQSE
ncbi:MULTISPECIES: hypothetical protein [unclassified Streptomyces]|uniref:hypothetical protein n=1 Tax=unclassified Streptomyces TaxID=2593676 RepID=UPI003318D625